MTSSSSRAFNQTPLRSDDVDAIQPAPLYTTIALNGSASGAPLLPVQITDLPQQPLGLVQRRPVAVRRPIAPRALPRNLGVAASCCAVASIKRQPRQEVMHVGLLQAVLAAVGDRQGLR